MGKHIIPQRRGKGGLVYQSPSHRHVAKPVHLAEGKYSVKEIIHAPGRNAPLLMVKSAQISGYQIAFNGAHVGQEISIGPGAGIADGSTTSLGVIPDGSIVYNIESQPGDGGKFCRTAGSGALVVSHGEAVTVKLASGKIRAFHPSCLATIGSVAGSGARDSPVLKAGNSVHFYRSKAKRPISVRGVAMNAVNHPHGGGNHQHVGGPSTVARGAPPGKKVGRLSPQRRKQ